MATRLILRDLLLLEVDALDQGKAAQVRAEIAQNPNCQRVWEQLHRVSAEWNQGQRSFKKLVRSGFDIDPEVIAAYLDGTLEKSQRKELEREAIRTPRLLRELLLHFRQHFSASPDGPVPASASEKLFQLGRGFEKQATAGPGLSAPLAAAVSQASTTALPVEIQMARTVSVTNSRNGGKRSRNWAVGIAGALTAGLLGAVWISGGFQQGAADQPERGSELASWDGKPQVEAVVPATGINSPAETRELAAASSNSRRPQTAAGAGDWVLVTLEDPPASDAAGTELDPSASVFHQQSGVLEDLTWLKLEGIVALREKGKETWFGPRSSARIFNGMEWQTLPGSWVAARLGKLGEIVLDADSSATVSVSPEEHLIGLEMQAGRVGLKKLAAQTKLRVKYDRLEWNAEVLSEGTAVGLDWLDGAPRLAVYAGSVRTPNRLLSETQQLVWSEPVKTSAGTVAISSRLGPLNESFAWLEKPTKVNALSDIEQAELLASANIVSSLNRLGAGRPASERVLAQYLPAVLSPEVHLLDVLEGAEQTSREEALEWLMGLSPRSPKTRQLWRTIAEKSGAPEHTREFFRLVQLARNSVPVSELDARFLVNGLKHERMFVREMCQLLLEYGFGNTARYDAAAEPLERNSAADRWSREILQTYQPQVVPKR